MPSRRAFLIGSIVPATGLLAGCSAVEEALPIGDDGESDLQITGTDSRGTSFGNIELGVRVENTSSDTQSGTLVGQVNVDGGDTYTQSRSITVPGGQANTYTLGIDIPISRSLAGGSYTYDAWLE